MQCFRRLGHRSQLRLNHYSISNRYFSAIKEISTNPHCLSQSPITTESQSPIPTQRQQTQTTNISNNDTKYQTTFDNNGFDIPQDAQPYDSKLIDSKLRGFPQLPYNRVQKTYMAVYYDSVTRTQGSTMTDYELICRGEYDGPTRETREFHVIHSDSKGNVSKGMKMSPFSTNFSTVEINEVLLNESDNIDDNDISVTSGSGSSGYGYQTQDTTRTHTIAKSVDSIDEEYNEYKTRIMNNNNSKIMPQQKELLFDEIETEMTNYNSNVLMNSNDRIMPVGIEGSIERITPGGGGVVNENTQPMGIEKQEEGQKRDVIPMLMRDDKKWRKHKMKKHILTKRRKRDRLKRIPGNLKRSPKKRFT